MRLVLSCIALALALLFVDGVTKAYVHATLPVMSLSSPFYPYGGIALFENFYGISFSISHSTNTGAAWGMFGGYQYPLVFVRIAATAAMMWYVFFYRRVRVWYLPFTCIVAGALGNIVDFFRYGHVVDMLYLTFWGYSYPVFNVADMAICVGAFLLAVRVIRQKSKNEAPVI